MLIENASFIGLSKLLEIAISEVKLKVRLREICLALLSELNVRKILNCNIYIF